MSVAGIQPLSERLTLHQPKAVITVMKVLEKEVNKTIGLAEITSVQFNVAVAFPAHSKTNADKRAQELLSGFGEVGGERGFYGIELKQFIVIKEASKKTDCQNDDSPFLIFRENSIKTYRRRA